MTTQQSAYVNIYSLFAASQSLAKHAERIDALLDIYADNDIDKNMLMEEANTELFNNLAREFDAISDTFRYVVIGAMGPRIVPR